MLQGQVLDQAGRPVMGATVRVLGSAAIGVTNPDGTFTLPVPLPAPLTPTLHCAYQGLAERQVVVTEPGESLLLVLPPADAATEAY